LVGLPPPSTTTVTAVKTSVFFSACKTRVVNRLPMAPAPQQAPQTTVVVSNLPTARALVRQHPTIVPVPSIVAPPADTMTCWDLKIARNEVFAHLGYAFKNYGLNAYFSRQSHGIPRL
jgi:hypothetical protein